MATYTARVVTTTDQPSIMPQEWRPKGRHFYWPRPMSIDQQVIVNCRCPTIGVAIWY